MRIPTIQEHLRSDIASLQFDCLLLMRAGHGIEFQLKTLALMVATLAQIEG